MLEEEGEERVPFAWRGCSRIEAALVACMGHRDSLGRISTVR